MADHEFSKIDIKYVRRCYIEASPKDYLGRYLHMYSKVDPMAH
jgi:hypothetical protein